MSEEYEDPRRKFLIRALGMGLYGAGATSSLLQSVFAMGDIPAKMPPGRSIYRLEGSVSVDGKPADITTQIGANSLVRTGRSSELIFVVGADAFIMRSDSELQLGGQNLLIEGMRLLTGKLLSVFGKGERPRRIQTTTATIGIRGTGIYVESDEEKSYVCTCYGDTVISSLQDPNVSEEIKASYHDKPLYILPANAGKIIQPAPFINHTDVELALIEELVGRTTPFAFSGGAYDAPRKRTY